MTKRKQVGTVKAFDGVIVAIDPGEHCGWAIYRRDACVDSGSCNGFAADVALKVLAAAQFFADVLEQPLVMVMEKPPAGGRAYAGRNAMGAGSVMVSRKLWRNAWRAHCAAMRARGKVMGAPLPRVGHRADVYPQSWRSAVLGVTYGPHLQDAEWTRAAGVMGKPANRVSRDEVAAVLIGLWAARAPVVHQLLLVRRAPKRTPKVISKVIKRKRSRSRKAA